MMISISNILLLALAAAHGCSAFLHSGINSASAVRRDILLLHSSTQATEPSSQPRSGIAQELLNLALKSPLWTYVMVPQARASIVKTAESNGIQWMNAKSWLNEQLSTKDYSDVVYPEYYKQSFHAYQDGNLSYDAAVEQELASRAVGARNFPKYGERGEDVFRDSFDKALAGIGARICDNTNEQGKKVIVDFGCGTGTSTRRMASQYPEVDQLIGIDLSPYFVDVGNTLLNLAPNAIENGSGWITSITPDERIELRQGDMANTSLPSNSASVVNLSLVVHELPTSVAKQVVSEAYRILQPGGGQLWISEMDFESTAYKAQRENALLFSLLRATEPYLDDYADGCKELREFIVDTFDSTKITAATGRHYALVAEKGFDSGDDVDRVKCLEDYRFREDGSYAVEDTHLKPWESKDD
mmetsp:Transcript_24459/g.37415  ORF Transcript_24459/g.37415 Transcript_24459/m.37415 type:complete len:415 (-) Transcript_24459:291-1535(-)